MMTNVSGEEVRKICGLEFGSLKIQLNRYHVEWTRCGLKDPWTWTGMGKGKDV